MWNIYRVQFFFVENLGEISFTNKEFLKIVLTADRLAQLVEYRTTVWEVVGSNPGRTNTQDL